MSTATDLLNPEVEEGGAEVPTDRIEMEAGWPCWTPDKGIRLRYNPYPPSPKQAAFLATTQIEGLYGGAAYGGKSIALLMAALMFCDVPGYNAIILRRTLQDLSLPDGLIDIAHDWLDGTEARWNGNKYRWTFPSGATLSFGYMAHLGSEQRYKSTQFQFIGFDELTEFPWERQFTYLFSRLRRGADQGASPDGLRMKDIPLRVRGATNPGGAGMAWVKRRYVDAETAIAPFLPSKMDDNPGADPGYRESLSRLEEAERRRLEDGDWDVVEVKGALWRFADLQGGWTDRTEPCPASEVGVRAIAVDPSVSEDNGKGDEVGIVMGSLTNGVMNVELDLSGMMHPDDWSVTVVTAYHAYGCTRVVVEDNQGKALLVSSLGNAADRLGLPRPTVLVVTPHESKDARAIPIVQAYRAQPRRATHDLTLRGGELESQLVSWVPGNSSPDRLDALVWLGRHLLYNEGRSVDYRTPPRDAEGQSLLSGRMPGV